MSITGSSPLIERISTRTENPQHLIAQPIATQKDSRTLGIYLSAVKATVDFLYYHQWTSTGEIVGALFGEPTETLSAGYLYPYGWTKTFTYFGLNPEELTPEQAKMRPILLLHGNQDNQSIWYYLAKKIHSLLGIKLGPVFSVNLPNGEVTQTDYDIINAKIDAICALYKKSGVENIAIDVVGHSRGGEIISKLLSKPELIKVQICKAILMGAVVRPEDFQKCHNMPNFSTRVLEINGKYDIIEKFLDSSLPQGQRLELNIGHLSLPFSDAAHERIIQFLQNVAS